MLNHRITSCIRYRRLLVCLTVGVCLAACESGADVPEVRTAFERFVGALESRDHAVLWELTDPTTRQALLTVTRRIDEARTFVPTIWGGPNTPETLRALDAIGTDLLVAAGADDEGRGPRIAAFLFRLDQLRWTEGSQESLKHAKVIIEKDKPNRAVVRIPSGESLSFENSAEGWKSTLLREFYLEATAFRTLSSNLDKTFALRDAARREWSATLDAREPQGAFNLLRRILKKHGDDPAPLFATLDETTVKHLGAALDASRKVQRRIQQKTSRALRPAAYESENIKVFVDARSDGELFSRWAKSHPLPEGLADDEPASFEASGDDAGVVVTAKGHRIPLRRRADGLWGLAWYADAAMTTLLAPVEARLADEAPRP